MVKKCRKWTDEEEAILRSKDYKSLGELARRLGRPPETIRYRAAKTFGNSSSKICDETCPDYCPYDECKLPMRLIKENVSKYLSPRTGEGRTIGKTATLFMDGKTKKKYGV